MFINTSLLSVMKAKRYMSILSRKYFLFRVYFAVFPLHLVYEAAIKVNSEQYLLFTPVNFTK